MVYSLSGAYLVKWKFVISKARLQVVKATDMFIANKDLWHGATSAELNHIGKLYRVVSDFYFVVFKAL